MAPIQQADVHLSIDELYDDEGWLHPAEDDDENEPSDFFLPTLNKQLGPYNLQLVEPGAMENPRLVCITTDQQAVRRLASVLDTVGLCLI